MVGGVPPFPCLEFRRGFWTPCRGRGVDLTPMSLIQLFVYFLGGDIFKTSIARLHAQNAASCLALPAGRNTGGIFEETIKRLILGFSRRHLEAIAGHGKASPNRR